MMPVMADPPLCRLRELQDGTYDLADVAMFNDMLLVKADNQSILHDIEERRRESARGR